jgi:hypothetical protein
MKSILRLSSANVATLILSTVAPCAMAGTTGTWQSLSYSFPDSSGVTSGMNLLSDGSVLVQSTETNLPLGSYSNKWWRLRPNAVGSYVSGIWGQPTWMISDRWFFSSQVLRDGRLYVAGGEYGGGSNKAEAYNPLTNAWTALPAPGLNIRDANSEMLADGRVLQALPDTSTDEKQVAIFDPVTNTFAAGPACLGSHRETSWVKLRDSSILMLDVNSTASERYIPEFDEWVADATVPVELFDDNSEIGGALLLPDGRAFFVGATTTTAYYTPSATGVTGSMGSWVAGPVLPTGLDADGVLGALGANDAPIAMLSNGKILMALSPVGITGKEFRYPTYFFELDTATNTFTAINAPQGGTSDPNSSCYEWNMLCLPDGTVLLAKARSQTLWTYQPSGTPLESAKPTITGMTRDSSGLVTLSGTQFNGINVGACYGDDWQTNTNFPIVRLTNDAGTVSYCRTSDWSTFDVQTGADIVTTKVAVSTSLASGAYSMELIANGFASDPWLYFIPSSACPADRILDGVINGEEISLVLNGWGAVNQFTTRADFDGNGTVDGFDLATVLAAWGSCTP